jgi:DNA modification methylase
MAKDLFGNDIIQDELLRDKFIEPPFSILDSKSGNWRNRVNKWKRLGFKSDLGRDAMINGSNSQKGYQKIMKQGKHKAHTGISIFDPALAELLYHWFCPEHGTILDPFAGGSVRGIVANYMGFKYTGIELRQQQVDSNREQALNILPINNQPQWYVGDSNEVLDIEFKHKFDLIFSCPPYADLEVYSDMPNDISNMPYNEFILAYKSIIKKSANHLKLGGYACFVVGEVRNKKGDYIGFVPDTIEAMKEAGLKYYNECIYLNGLAGACLTAGRIMGISKKVKKVHQNVLIFKKH